MPFGLWSQVRRRKHKFNRIREVRWRQRALMGGHVGATWRMRLKCPSGGDAALCQITLITCCY